MTDPRIQTLSTVAHVDSWVGTGRFHLPASRGIEILRVEVGSTLHGTGLPGGEDLDLMGIAVPALPAAAGLDGHWETWTARTQPQGVKSGPGDIDLTVHTIHKYLRLALNGNPSVLLLLFADGDYVHMTSPLGESLRREAPSWVASKRAGAAFSGYLDQQRRRFRGERARHGKTRPDLIAEHGYDTKYAMHMVRLGLQGIEFLTTGRLTLPMQGDSAELCRAIRRGDYTRAWVDGYIEQLDSDLKRVIAASDLPEQPNHAAAHTWCVAACSLLWHEPAAAVAAAYPFTAAP